MRLRCQASLRRAARWLGAAVCIALVGLWLLSCGERVYWWYWIGGRDAWQVELGQGVVVLYRISPPSVVLEPGIKAGIRPLGDNDPGGWWRWRKYWIHTFRSNRVAWTVVPLWMPLMLVAAPTACLWWRDGRWRRARAGLCPRCGYARSGLAVGAACPECGGAARSAVV